MSSISLSQRMRLVHAHCTRILDRTRETHPAASQLRSWELVLPEVRAAETTFQALEKQSEEALAREDVFEQYLLAHHAHSLLSHLRESVFFMASSYDLTHHQEIGHVELMEELLTEMDVDLHVTALRMSAASASLKRHLRDSPRN